MQSLKQRSVLGLQTPQTILQLTAEEMGLRPRPAIGQLDSTTVVSLIARHIKTFQFQGLLQLHGLLQTLQGTAQLHRLLREWQHR